MPSRRKQIDMTPQERRVYLLSQAHLIIVSNGPEGYPHPMPMNFILDEEDRFLVTTFRKSQKVKNFERDPKAALLVESGVAYHELKSVLAYAEAEIIADYTMVLETMAALIAKEKGAENTELRLLGEQGRKTAAKRLVLRFKPHRYVSWDHSKLGGRY